MPYQNITIVRFRIRASVNIATLKYIHRGDTLLKVCCHLGSYRKFKSAHNAGRQIVPFATDAFRDQMVLLTSLKLLLNAMVAASPPA